MKLRSKVIDLLVPGQRLRCEPLWIDGEDAPTAIGELDCSDHIKDYLRLLRTDGYAVVNSALTDPECDRICDSFRDYCAVNPESTNYRDQYGYYDRLASFHLVSDSVEPILSHPCIRQVLDLVFSCSPEIVGSLYFDKSSEQSIHRDTPTFFTNPLNHFLGVWFALEDIGHDQGPLVYYRGSHRLLDDARLRYEFDNAEDYNSAIEQSCHNSDLSLKEFHANKGDAIIWHPQLAHGGMVRRDRTKSRRSMVMHWKSSRASIHPPTDFFSGYSRLSRSGTHYRELHGFRAIDHGNPRFFVNRSEGNFDEF